MSLRNKIADKLSGRIHKFLLDPQLKRMKSEVRSGNSPVLSVDGYDEAERRAVIGLSVPHLMAFTPVSYQMVGWPHRIRDQRELARFADHNFEAEIAGLFQPGARFDPVGYRNSFTQDETELIANVRDTVRRFTEDWFGRRVAPISNILVQMGPFRMMEQFKKQFGKPNLSVFEVGPGAGYLGAFLSVTGHRYGSYDIAQSYYLWQSCLMQATGGEDFVEFATLDDHPSPTAVVEARVAHIPWWQYASFLGASPVKADIVYSNSNLSEMSRVSLRMVLQISRMMLQDSDIGVFTFFSKGMPAQTPHEQMDAEFEMFGYHKVFEAPFFAYTTKPEQVDRIRAMFANGIDDYDPSGRGGSYTANEATALNRSEAPLDAQLTQWYHGWQPPFVD